MTTVVPSPAAVQFDRILAPAVISLACLTALLGCGGGDDDPKPPVCDDCTVNTTILTGTAAAGAPLAGASIAAIDATGARRAGSIDATGAFTIDVSGMTAPFILEATGSVGGQVVQYHSLAVAADVGRNTVNVTPLTEVMSAIVLGGVPSTLIASGTQDATKITAAAIGSAESTVEALVSPVLQAAGVGTVDLRTTAFAADDSGLDLALDGLQVQLVNGAYALSTSLSAATATVVPAQPVTSAPLTVPAGGAALLAAGTTAASSLQSVMSTLTARFNGTQLPAASSLTPLLAADFLHNGQPGAAYVQNILLQDSGSGTSAFNLLGATFDQVKVIQVIDAANVRFQFRVATGLPYRPWSEAMLATQVNGQWLLRGDQRQLGASVTAYAQLRETPATLAEMTALGATLDALATPPRYSFSVLDASGASVGAAYLGYPGDSVFGRLGFIGDGVTPAGRLLQATYPLYFAHPDSHVYLQIQFAIQNNRIAANAVSVTVTGPGLPTQGLQLEPSPSTSPRDTWMFPGNAGYITNQFSDYACLLLNQGTHPIANCGLDWSQISTGAEYSFAAVDAAGTVLDIVASRLPIMPLQSESQLLDHRASLFAQVAPAVSRQFSLSNFYKVNGPFAAGKAVAASWALPTAPGSQMQGVTFFQQWTDATGATVSSSADFHPMYGLQPAPTTTTFTATAPGLLDWASVTTFAYDAFGNLYEHQVDGNNHQ